MERQETAAAELAKLVAEQERVQAELADLESRRDEQVAVLYPTGQYPRPVTIPLSSNIRESWLVAYHLPNNLGSIVGLVDDGIRQQGNPPPCSRSSSECGRTPVGWAPRG